jgi:hypothetical protein
MPIMMLDYDRLSFRRRLEGLEYEHDGGGGGLGLRAYTPFLKVIGDVV